MLSLVHWVFARTIAFALHANTHGETGRRLLRTLLITCPVCCVLECHVMLSEVCQYTVVGTLGRHTLVHTSCKCMPIHCGGHTRKARNGS